MIAHATPMLERRYTRNKAILRGGSLFPSLFSGSSKFVVIQGLGAVG
jgi:hypothetical protein